MYTYIVHAAYGWLAVTGVLHFLVDVVWHHLRGTRGSESDSMLYYGVHAAFSLGQVVFGLLGLFLARRAIGVLREAPVMVLTLVAGLAWLEMSMLFMDYWEPTFNAAVFCVLVLAAFFKR